MLADMRIRLLATLLSSLALAVATSPPSSALAADWYVSVDGTDPDGCEDGTPESPWLTWTGPRTQGCIQPGDTVYFMAGVYESGTGVFDGNNSKLIRLQGEEGAPIRLAADPKATGDWPVTFRGSFNLAGAGWGVIEGIEFEGDGEANVVLVSTSHITLDGCLVRGLVADIDLENSGNYDCVKILAADADQNQLEDIQILGCTIRDCTQDAIDVTGARDVVYRNNEITNSWTMQVKGGTENILIEQNLIHDVRNGLNGSGVRGVNTGSPVIPTLPMDERFVARDVVIRNNVIRGVENWTTFGARGWQNVEIHHNTIYQASSHLLVLEAAGFETDDPIAAAYCETNPCDPCSNNQPDCWQVDFQARDVHFKNNIVHSPDLYAIRGYSAALDGFEASNNLYYSSDGDVEFRVDGDSYSLASFPYETDSQEIDPGLVDLTTYDLSLAEDSVAIDGGADVGVTTDFLGLPRDAAPDIGAYEYGAMPDEDDDDSAGDDDDSAGDDDDAAGDDDDAAGDTSSDTIGCGCRLTPRSAPLAPTSGWLLAVLFIGSRRSSRTARHASARLRAADCTSTPEGA